MTIEYYWSAEIGKFVDKTTGDPQSGASFSLLTDQIADSKERLWHETLIEVIIDAANRLNGDLNIGGGDYIQIELETTRHVLKILCDSVLWGRKSVCGLNLQAEVKPDLSTHRIDFRDSWTDALLASVHILDL